MVRLITHNILQCHVKNCNNGFPLRFENAEVVHTEQEMNTQFLMNMLPRLEWDALRSSAQEVSIYFIDLGLPP
jgi:multifunctional methyltransferase subunit TRM112